MEADIRKFIDDVLKDYAKKSDFILEKDFSYDLHLTREAARGDYAANVAFKLAKVARSKPAVIAGELKQCAETKTDKIKDRLIEKIEVAGGGFLNFYLKKTSLAEVLAEVFKKNEKYGESNFGNGRKVILEYVSANPTGPLTIAHGRQAAIGDSLSRILKMSGHAVHREFYLNDAGRQMRLLGQSLWARYREQFKLESPLPEDGYQGEYLIALAKQLIGERGDTLLKEKDDKAAEFCTEYAKNQMMESIEDDLARFRVVFDEYYSEKSLSKHNGVEKALDFLKEKGALFEEEGALWFRSTALGDDKDRVVRKSSGEYTYLAPDIAYHKTKYERGYEWLINLWGPDHHGYIARLKAACQMLGFKRDGIDIRIVQLTTLFRKGEPVRMSTRAGQFVTLKELIDEVGVDVARFFFIMRRVESPLDFDLDLAKEKSQENPVFYLQYAHARIASILKFSKKSINPKADLAKLTEKEENDLIKMITDFPNILVQASQMLEPYRLADYLRDLAAAFHKFYVLHRVVTDDEALTDARLLMVHAVRVVLRNGLECLGIDQPDEM